MAIDASTHNPFQPPETAAEFEGLAPDTEFLVSDECILCGDEIVLPAVCIQSGQKSDLVRKSATLKWGPPLITNLFVVMLIFVGPAVGYGALMAQGLNRGLARANPSWIAMIWTVAAFGVFGATAFLWWLVFQLKRAVRVTWFVHQSELLRHQKKLRRRGFCLIALVFAVGVLILLAVYVDREFTGLVTVSVLAGLFLLSSLWQKIEPVFAGRHEGLNILAGLSPLFLKEVQAIISRHHEK